MGKLAKGAIVIIIATILIFTASWAVYSAINQGAGDILTKMGVENVYAQAGVVVLFVVILLAVLGFSFTKVIRKILRLD